MGKTSDKTETTKDVSLGIGGPLVEYPERGSWSSPVEFVLSCIGYAIGIGNVWRFPYLVYRNGGGAFLVPFVLMLIIMGLPIFFLELVIGQYSRQGPTESFRRLAPLFHGLGYCTILVIALVTVYYMVIVSWTLFYVFASFFPTLSWAYCDNDFNSEKCYSGLQDLACQAGNNGTIFFNKTCTAITDVCAKYGYMFGGNTTHCFANGLNTSGATDLHSLYPRVLSSEEYFNDYVLGLRGATWENWGGMRWELLGCLTLAWTICFFCLIKGVQSIGKIVYFTALFPYFVLIALLIRGATLEGAAEGCSWYITPEWSTLTKATVWADAASQVFYSLGIGCGSLITLSSYSAFNNNCHKDAVIVTLANLLTSVFAGFVIFSIMGFLAQQMHLPIHKVVRSETGLAFIAYPEAVVRMPLPNLWSILFFLMLFILGLGSQFGGVQAINSTILDLWPELRKRESYVILGICVAGWLLALPMVFDGGIYLFTLMDWNTASWAILLIGFAEIIVASWCYGCSKFLDNVGEMQIVFGRFLYRYWWVSWVVLAPITTMGLFIYQLYMYEPPKFGAYIFPSWANNIGLMIGLSTLAPLPIFAIYELWKGPRDSTLFKAMSSWGPSDKVTLVVKDSFNNAAENPSFVQSSDPL